MYFPPEALLITPTIVSTEMATGIPRTLDLECEKNHKKGGLNCVFGNFFFYVLDNCPQVQSLK